MPARSAPAGHRWSWWSPATLDALQSGVPPAVAVGTPHYWIAMNCHAAARLAASVARGKGIPPDIAEMSVDEAAISPNRFTRH